MARVNGAEVKQIIETDLTAAEIDPFITVANILVDQITGLSAATLKEIERWLAAHYVAIRDPRQTKEVIGDAEDTYAVKVGFGLDGTTYGQQAKALDTTGTLVSMGKKKGYIKAR